MTSLSREHRSHLTEAGITRTVIRQRGYLTARLPSELTERGFGPTAAKAVPSLVIPIHDVHGNVAFHQSRPDEPRVVRGKPVKYETPAGTRMVLDVPPCVRARLGDPSIPLFVTEGVKKADAAASVGMACVDLLGVFNFRGRNELGGVAALPDWESIALNGRTVYIVFDSDVMRKHQVAQALRRLHAFLSSRSAHCLPIYLPSREDGRKVGLDDFLAEGHSVDDVIAHAKNKVLASPEGPYQGTEYGLVWNKPDLNGVNTQVPIANFQASITRQDIVDDGVDQQRTFLISTQLGDRKKDIPVDAAKFATRTHTWVIEHLGANAIVVPSIGATHLNAAIQSVSGDVPEHVAYGHTGWRELPDGEVVYLHGGGAIGPRGSREDLTVRLPLALSRFELPAPPSRRQARDLMRASFALLDVTDDSIAIPLMAAAYRAALFGCDFAVYLTGRTGCGKSELTALAQQHFGAQMDARHLPGSYSSTANALERQAFVLKDALFSVDDFAPSGGRGDIDKLHGIAERLIRNAGNGAGRARLNQDSSMRKTYYSRGLILTSGEEVPRNHSVRARTLLIDVKPDDLDWDILTALQKSAANGDSALLMVSFLQWHASRRTPWLAAKNDRLATYRKRVAAHHAAAHRRTPAIVAELFLGITTFTSFAVSIGALDTAEAKAFRRRCWSGLITAAASQADHQTAADPVQRCRDILSDALAAGQAGLWRPPATKHQRGSWIGGEPQIGWAIGDDVYLIPNTTFQFVTTACRRGDGELGLSETTLWKRWAEADVLRTTDTSRKRLKTRINIEGKRREVLHVGLDWLSA